MTIRPATLADVPTLVELGSRFLASSVYGAHFRENPAQIADLATMLVTHDDGVVFVADEHGAILGAIGMWVCAHVWTGDRTAGELFWFVDAQARGSIGIGLFRAAEAWAVTTGAHSMQMVSPAVQEGEADRVAAIYQRSGFVPLERGWVRAL
jgi:GNAT superfamily N-acetyltransferase